MNVSVFSVNPACLQYAFIFSQIKEELNNPTSEAVKRLKTHGGHWECSTSDVAGYMFRVILKLPLKTRLLIYLCEGWCSHSLKELFLRDQSPCGSLHF